MTKKFLIAIIAIILAPMVFLVDMSLLTLAFSLMSAPDNLMVTLGVGIISSLAAIHVVALFVIVKLLTKQKPKVK